VLREIWAGLNRPQKQLSSKFLYDHRGSELFERITRLPEYYPTRCEYRILESWMPELIAVFEPGAIVELGAGSGAKTRILLRAMAELSGRRVFVPIDVSESFLHHSAGQLGREFPGLEVVPVVGDINRRWQLPPDLPAPRLHIFLGGTIGNFTPQQAVELLDRVRRSMSPDDRFVLGFDLRKDPAVIEAAYNDAHGVTAEFNLNMLHALNRDHGTNFDPAAFRHRAFYDTILHRIEMHLDCTGTHIVRVPGHGSVAIEQGESIRTEISCKYDADSIGRLFTAAGLEVVELRSDDSGSFAAVEGAPGT